VAATEANIGLRFAFNCCCCCCCCGRGSLLAVVIRRARESECHLCSGGIVPVVECGCCGGSVAPTPIPAPNTAFFILASLG
jgi:hypothetical protein